jgi:hypothetical protein
MILLPSKARIAIILGNLLERKLLPKKMEVIIPTLLDITGLILIGFFLFLSLPLLYRNRNKDMHRNKSRQRHKRRSQATSFPPYPNTNTWQ